MILEIILASIAGFVFGAAWYMSPIGKVWMNNRTWADQENPKWRSGAYMARMYPTSLVITMVVAYVLNVIYTVLDVQTLAQYLQVAWLLCFGFVVTTKFNDMIYTNTPPFWGKRAQLVFLIDAGYNIGLYTVLATVLYYLTW
jgi:hypothetical protein